MFFYRITYIYEYVASIKSSYYNYAVYVYYSICLLFSIVNKIFILYEKLFCLVDIKYLCVNNCNLHCIKTCLIDIEQCPIFVRYQNDNNVLCNSIILAIYAFVSYTKKQLSTT